MGNELGKRSTTLCATLPSGDLLEAKTSRAGDLLSTPQDQYLSPILKGYQPGKIRLTGNFSFE